MHGAGSSQPAPDHGAEDHPQHRRGGVQGPAGEDEPLLDERAPGLAQGVADDVDGRLALRARLRAQRDVGHLLAGVEEGVLGGLGSAVLGGPDEDGQREGRGAEAGGRPFPEGGGQEEAEEHGPGPPHDAGGDRRRGAPAQAAEHLPADEHQEEREQPRGGGEGAHEGAVAVGVGVPGLEPALPRGLHDRDAHAVADHEQGQGPDVPALRQQRGARPEGQAGPLARRAPPAGVHARGFRQDGPLDVRAARQQDARRGDHAAHQPAEGRAPRVRTRGALGPAGHLPVLPRQDGGHVRDEPQEGVVPPGLRHGADLVGQAPEQSGNHHRPPTLRHEVEQGEGPVAEDRDKGHEGGGQAGGERVSRGLRVEESPGGVHDRGEQREEAEEAGDHDVEHADRGHAVAQFGEQQGPQHGAWQLDVRLEEWQDLGPRLGCGDHDDIFGVDENCVAEKPEECHDSQGDELLGLGRRCHNWRPVGRPRAAPISTDGGLGGRARLRVTPAWEVAPLASALAMGFHAICLSELGPIGRLGRCLIATGNHIHTVVRTRTTEGAHISNTLAANSYKTSNSRVSPPGMKEQKQI